MTNSSNPQCHLRGATFLIYAGEFVLAAGEGVLVAGTSLSVGTCRVGVVGDGLTSKAEWGTTWMGTSPARISAGPASGGRNDRSTPM